MTADQASILEQLTDFCRERLWPGLATLSDQEYLWQPAAGCWTIRRTADGGTRVDWAMPPPEPSPPTTIAWRMAFVVSNLAARAHHHFGAPSFRPDLHAWPLTARAGTELLTETVLDWCRRLGRLDPAELSRPAGETEGKHREHSLAAMALNANCQVIHHGSAILLQRVMAADPR